VNILVIGSGAREHAIVWKCIQSELADRVLCAPGNAGISMIARCIDIKADDIENLVEFAKEKIGKDGLTIVGPEVPLVWGIAYRFEQEGLLILGPSKAAALIEGSKYFCKCFLQGHGIKTADFKLFGRASNAREYINKEYDQGRGRSLVIKADGLASGKGVIVAKTRESAIHAVETISHSPAGYLFLVEECLVGWECSFTVLTDGKNIVPLPVSKDYKRLSDGDEGPNTGGMGGYSPVPAVTPKLYDEMLEIARCVVLGLRIEGRIFKGFLYIGFMITKDGPYVLEINCRLGDPEAQVILPLLDSDFVELCYRAAKGDLLNATKPIWGSDALVNVVIASPGYPENPKIGYKIYGLEEAAKEGALVFHASTAAGQTHHKNSKFFKTNGGRILSVVGRGEVIEKAREQAYRAASKISFGRKSPNKGFQQYRKDIARNV